MNAFELIKEKLEGIRNVTWDECYGYMFRMDDVYEIVDEVAQEYNNGWIPCSERLPEEHDSTFAEVKGTDKWREGMFEKSSDDVYVTVKYENGKVKSMTTCTIDGKWKLNSIVRGEVTHWQPLPEPYKGGGDKKC